MRLVSSLGNFCRAFSFSTTPSSVNYCDVDSERATRITERNSKRRIRSARFGNRLDRERNGAATTGRNALRGGCDLQVGIRGGGNSAGAGDANVNTSRAGAIFPDRYRSDI